MRHFLTRRRFAAFTAVTVLLLTVAGAAVRNWRHQASMNGVQPFTPPMSVATITVDKLTKYERPRVYTGVLRERRRSVLSFQRPGELVDLAVDEGDAVQRDQEIGRLDDRHVRARHLQLQAQLTEARATLDELASGPRTETIAAKRAQLQQLEAQRDLLEKQLERRRQALRSASVSKEEYETFQFELRAATARAEAVGHELDELLAGTRTEQLDAQRARLAQLQAALKDVEHDLDDAILRAPFAGRVSKRLIDEGTVVAVGTPVLEIVDNAKLEARIGFPPEVAAELAIGQPYELAVGDGIASAKVKALAPDLDIATRTRAVVFVLDDADERFVPSQVARISISEQIVETGYWVPSTSLVQSTRGLWSVYAVDRRGDEEIIERRDVELIDTLGQQSFVRGTLEDNQRIVATGAHRVVVGQRVSVAERWTHASFSNPSAQIEGAVLQRPRAASEQMQ